MKAQVFIQVIRLKKRLGESEYSSVWGGLPFSVPEIGHEISLAGQFRGQSQLLIDYGILYLRIKCGGCLRSPRTRNSCINIVILEGSQRQMKCAGGAQIPQGLLGP